MGNFKTITFPGNFDKPSFNYNLLGGAIGFYGSTLNARS